MVSNDLKYGQYFILLHILGAQQLPSPFTFIFKTSCKISNVLRKNYIGFERVNYHLLIIFIFVLLQLICQFNESQAKSLQCAVAMQNSIVKLTHQGHIPRQQGQHWPFLSTGRAQLTGGHDSEKQLMAPSRQTQLEQTLGFQDSAARKMSPSSFLQ